MDDSQNEAKVTKTYLRDAVDAVLEGRDRRGDRDPPGRLRHQVQEVIRIARDPSAAPMGVRATAAADAIPPAAALRLILID